MLIKQFKDMLHSEISHGELERAKTQLKSTLLMNLEYRTIVLEDIGRLVALENVLGSAIRKYITLVQECIGSWAAFETNATCRWI